MSIRQRREGQWQVDISFRHPDGRIQRVKLNSPVNTRRRAEQYERQVRQSLQDGTFRKEAEPEAPTLDEFKERFLTNSRNDNKPSMLAQKTQILANHLIPAFGKLNLDQITRAMIEDYKASKVKEGLERGTVNNHLAILNRIFTLAIEDELITRKPKVKRFKVNDEKPPYLDHDETARFLGNTDPEWLPMVTIALRTGLRSGELRALKWEDVDLVAGNLHVCRTLWNGHEGSPKGGRNRIVPLSDEAIAVLKAHRLKTGFSKRVFCRPDGKDLMHCDIQDVVPRICRKAGLAKRLNWHGLRHTFASHLVMNGVPLRTVQELLGHASINQTLRYSHLAPTHLRSAVQLLDQGNDALHREPIRNKGTQQAPILKEVQ